MCVICSEERFVRLPSPPGPLRQMASPLGPAVMGVLAERSVARRRVAVWKPSIVGIRTSRRTTAKSVSRARAGSFSGRRAMQGIVKPLKNRLQSEQVGRRVVDEQNIDRLGTHCTGLLERHMVAAEIDTCA